MGGSAWSNDQPLNLTIPANAGPSDARTVIGVNPIPSELVTYYLTLPALSGITKPETIVGLTVSYDGKGNYAYAGLVIDSTPVNPITSQVTGEMVGVAVNETSRVTLNPGAVLGGGRTEYSLESATLILRTDPNNATSQTVLGTRIPADSAHRFSVAADGTLGWGPGGATLTDTYLTRGAVGQMELGSYLRIRQFLTTRDPAFEIIENGEAVARLSILASGKHQWSDGTAAADTSVYRAAAAVIGADDIRWNSAGAAETWHALTLQNSWVNNAGGFVTAQYRRIASPANSVEVVGVIKAGTTANGTVIGNLPAGYRPANTVRNPVYAFGATLNIATEVPAFDTASSGNITLLGSVNAGVIAFHFTIPLDA